MPLDPGQRLGPYEILEPLGSGGMGEVYRARDTRLDREVAIKVVRPDGAGDAAQRAARLEREARTVARLDHPNLLTLFDVGHFQGALYLVTELLRGETLRERLAARGPLSASEAIELGEQVALGLAAAHARAIVHRDLKPENVFRTADGRVKILDFGLALERPRPAGLEPTVDFAPDRIPTLGRTEEGAVLGTAPYLSPEQARGGRADERSDLFALGVLLHECLTGTSPFLRPSFAETLGAVLHAPAPPLDDVAGASGLARLVARCLAKLPEERPASAAEVADALGRLRGSAAAGLAPPAGRSIAVLPFLDMSAARDQGYFCEGMAEEILHALSRVSGLRVAARSSSFQFPAGGRDVRELGAKLGVGAILEGSVRRAGERLRVTVQLVDVATGYQLWSERFDRDVADVFAIQDEIAASVAGALSAVLTDGARQALRRRGTQQLAAYEAYLRGRQLAAQYRARAWRAAVREYEEAIDRDPAFVAAWAGLAEAYSYLYLWVGHGAEDLAAAQRASARALELDPEDPDTLVARAQVLLLENRTEESEQTFERALARAPDHWLALYLFARLRFGQGRMAEAAALFERAAAVDPDDYQSLSLSLMAYEAIGRPEQILDTARRALARVERRLEIAPADPRALYLGGGDLVHLGERDRALEWLRRASRIDPDEVSTMYNVACGLARLGESDEALALLERIAELGFAYRAWVEHDTDLDSLRALPRFRALLDKLL